jgi:hypothetical protein
MMRVVAWVSAFLVISASAGRARAQDTKAARATEAKKACSANHPDQGIEILAGLYSESGDPAYVRNQGRCYQQNGRNQEAALKFKEYLRIAKNLDASERAEIEGYIHESEKEAAPVVPVAPPPAPAPAPSPVSADTGPVAGGSLDLTRQVPPPVAESNPGGGLRIAGLVAGGVGVASIVVGAIFGAQAKDKAKQLQDKVVPGSTYDASLKSLDDKGRSAQTMEWVFLGVGGAALIGGGVLYIIGSSQHATVAQNASPAGMAVAILPTISPRDLGASLQVTF